VTSYERWFPRPSVNVERFQMTVPQAHLLLAEETAFSFAKHCPSCSQQHAMEFALTH
jgi:hypothetical protein